MPSNLSEFRVLLDLYEDEPAACSKRLRTSALTNPVHFLAWAQSELAERPPSRVMKLIAGMAISAGLIPALLKLHQRDRSQATNLARKVMQCEPKLESHLVDCMVRPEPGASLDESSLYATLDLLDAISDGDQLVPSVLKMLKHDSPRIRSKAALFVGSRTQNLSWAASRAGEGDGRVRANILESLHAVTADGAHTIFNNHINDANNRAAGNAVLGLYRLGSAEAIPLALGMARHLDSRFRNTAAWLIGRTGDPRFMSTIAELMQDVDPIVRSQAFKAMGALKKAAKLARPGLDVSAVADAPDEKTKWVSALVLDDQQKPVKGIPATGFILRGGGGKPIANFSVTEQEQRGPINLAFVLCCGPESEPLAESKSGTDKAHLSAIELCLPLRRPADRWSIVQLKRSAARAESAPSAWRGHSQLGIFQGETSQKIDADSISVEFTAQAGRLEQFLAAPPQAFSTNQNLDAFVLTLKKPEKTVTSPHVILLGDDTATKEEIAKSLGGLGAAVTFVSNTPLKEDATLICSRKVRSMVQHYRLYCSDDEPLTLEVRHADQTGQCAISWPAPAWPEAHEMNRDYKDVLGPVSRIA